MRRSTLAAMISVLLASTQGPLLAPDLAAQETSDPEPPPSFWEEAGYVLAMETAFTGLSLLGSRENGWGPAITGGFDLVIAVAGLENASQKESGIQKTGHYLVAAGFVAKSLYNFHLGKDHSGGTRFWANLIGYNALVFFGYFLDTL